jgi:hypothetical protein
VTEDNLATLGDTLFITRLPTTYSECGRVIAEAVAHNHWEEVGVLTQTPPTKHRPGTFYKVAEGVVTLYGKTYRAVVVHSNSQDQRRQQRLEREVQEAATTLGTAVRVALKQEYCCRADAEAAAEQLRALQSAYHRVAVVIEDAGSMALAGRARSNPVLPKRCGMACRLRSRNGRRSLPVSGKRRAVLCS